MRYVWQKAGQRPDRSKQKICYSSAMRWFEWGSVLQACLHKHFLIQISIWWNHQASCFHEYGNKKMSWLNCNQNMYRKTRFRKEKMFPEPCFLVAMHMEEAAGDSFCKYSCCHCRKWAGFCTYAVNKKTSAFCTPCCLVSVCVSKNISIWCPRTPPPSSSAVYTLSLIHI